jgi:hypothetical protein
MPAAITADTSAYKTSTTTAVENPAKRGRKKGAATAIKRTDCRRQASSNEAAQSNKNNSGSSDSSSASSSSVSTAVQQSAITDADTEVTRKRSAPTDSDTTVPVKRSKRAAALASGLATDSAGRGTSNMTQVVGSIVNVSTSSCSSSNAAMSNGKRHKTATGTAKRATGECCITTSIVSTHAVSVFILNCASHDT